MTPIHERSPSTYFCVLTIRKHLLKMRFERSGRGQEPSRGHKFSILENVVLHRDFTSQTLAIILSDLVGACLPQTLLRTDKEELCQFDIIPPTTERNRAFPTGNALLYISLSYVDFSGCVRRGAPYFCFIMVGCMSKRIYRFFFSLAASWLVLRCSTIWANHSTIAGSS